MSQDLIQTIDFDALYQEQCRRSSFGPRTSTDWDRRAERRNRHEPDSDYSRAFLARVDLAGAKTALDIGCGTGNLAIPLAQRLRQVYALDFSPEMLRYLEKNRRHAGVDNLVAHRLSWTDSWKEIPAVDIVVCSRAMSVEHLRDALEKLNRKTKLRAYLTIRSGGSYLGPEVSDLLERTLEPRPDYIYAVNVLYQMGVRARVDFLRSTSNTTYASPVDFIESIQWRVGTLTKKEGSRLRKFFRGLPRAADGRTRYQHDFEWAMLSWEKKGGTGRRNAIPEKTAKNA